MDTKTKQRLLAEYAKHAATMIDVEHIAQTVAEGMDTDIKIGDTVISTNYYEAGMFVVPQLYREAPRQETTRDEHGRRQVRKWVELIPTQNPWCEWVKTNSKESRCASLSIKCKATDAGAREEMRIKVRKLCLFRWDEAKQSYPEIGGDILFRSVRMSFAIAHRGELDYYRRAQTFAWLSEEKRQEARRYLAVLERLAAIPPFSCFYDEKYGFLIKRTIRPARIVVAESYARLSVERSVGGLVAKEVEARVSEFEAHLDRREALAVADGRAEFKEQIVVEAMKPERVEALVTKHGEDGVERQFEPFVVGEGGQPKPKRKVIKVRL